MITLDEFIRARLTQRTAKRYSCDIQNYLDAVAEPETAKYKDVMSYVKGLRAVYKDSGNVNVCMAGISKYYDWLVHTGRRKDNPCKNISLKSNRNRTIKHYLLFTEKELEQLLDRVERYKDMEYRNKVLLSLLVYQGLTNEEIVNLQVSDINLKEGKIRIVPTHTTNGRTLNLRTTQVMLFNKYLTESRLILLKGKVHTDSFIVTKLGTAEKGEGINYLTSTFKSLFPGRKLNPITIRQSILTNMYKAGHDTREIQLFCGLKYPSSVEMYRPDNDEEMKDAIGRFHPLA